MTECLCYMFHYFIKDIGYGWTHPGTYVAFVRLVVNGKYEGLYCAIEQKDQAWFENRMWYQKEATWLYKKADTVKEYRIEGSYEPTKKANVDAQLSFIAAIQFGESRDGRSEFFRADWDKGRVSAGEIYMATDLDDGMKIFKNEKSSVLQPLDSNRITRTYRNHTERYLELWKSFICADGPLSTSALDAYLDAISEDITKAIAEDPHWQQKKFDIQASRNWLHIRVGHVKAEVGCVDSS
jgi:hypothetical protein